LISDGEEIDEDVVVKKIKLNSIKSSDKISIIA
jgi:hypothetical protein